MQCDELAQNPRTRGVSQGQCSVQAALGSAVGPGLVNNQGRLGQWGLKVKGPGNPWRAYVKLQASGLRPVRGVGFQQVLDKPWATLESPAS